MSLLELAIKPIRVLETRVGTWGPILLAAWLLSRGACPRPWPALLPRYYRRFAARYRGQTYRVHRVLYYVRIQRDRIPECRNKVRYSTSTPYSVLLRTVSTVY